MCACGFICDVEKPTSICGAVTKTNKHLWCRYWELTTLVMTLTNVDTPLRLPAPQDAGKDGGAYLPWLLEEVVWLQPRSNRVRLDYNVPEPSAEVFAGAQ
jgi:hypothetical protein